MSTKFGRYYPALGGKTNERERLLFIAAAGLAFSLLVVLFVVFSFGSKSEDSRVAAANTSSVPAAIGTVTLLAPEMPVRAGARLADVKFQEVYWPRNQVPEGAVRDINELKDWFAKADLQAKMPIQRSQLSREPIQTTLPVSPGNRAVSFELGASEGVEGHALPGTRVDVVLTFYENGSLVSKVIVQNARVLSYGGDFTPLERRALNVSGPRATSRTITLDVTPKDALSITTAKQVGKLSLMMRSPEDDKGVRDIEYGQEKFNDSQPRDRRNNSGNCTKGTVRMEGKQYVMGCDGSINQLMNPDEP